MGKRPEVGHETECVAEWWFLFGLVACPTVAMSVILFSAIGIGDQV
jgi:hypothetical protein